VARDFDDPRFDDPRFEDPSFDASVAAPPLDPLDEEQLESEAGGSQVDELLDELVPPDLDWRRVVTRYPIPSLLVAAAAGYLLGRSRRGVAVAEALVGAAALGVTKHFVDADLGVGLE
jgi:hypothetical protein